jgi:hypothetical protein
LNRSLKLMTSSLFCLVLALVMPAIRVQVFRTPVDLSGWQAAIWALGLGGQSLLDAVTQPVDQAWRCIVLGLAAAMNIAFVLALIALVRNARARNDGRWLIGLALFGGLLAAAAPWLPENPPAKTLMGYYVWLTAYLMLLAALVCKREKRGPRAAGL